MDTKLLKQKILDLAIRGKLVPQDPNDEPASILLEKIKKEKEKLIKEGKIKKDKKESTIFLGDDKLHYEKLLDEKPNIWEIIKLDDVLYYEQPTPYIVNDTKYDDKYLTPVLTAGKSFILGYTDEKFGIFKNFPCIIFDDFTTDTKYVDFSFKVKSSAMKILHCNTSVNIKFIFYSIQLLSCNVDTHKRFWISLYSQKNIYLPPKSYQDKVVNLIETLFQQVDAIEEEKQSLLKLIDKAKNKVLDLAMTGKLVKQDPNDEPASRLLEKIFEEKKKLAKEGKIKLSKDELLSPPTSVDNDYYQDIPTNWRIVELGKICEIARGGSPRPIDEYITSSNIDSYNWIKIGDTEVGAKYITSAKQKIIKEGLSHTRYVEIGDFLLSNSMSFGRPYILKINGCIHDGWLVIHNIYQVLDQNFLYYLLSSKLMYNQMLNLAKGSTVKNLKSDTVKLLRIPLPPFNLQKRIANFVEKFLSDLEKIRDSL